jgi:hypothetical protein
MATAGATLAEAKVILGRENFILNCLMMRLQLLFDLSCEYGHNRTTYSAAFTSGPEN